MLTQWDAYVNSNLHCVLRAQIEKDYAVSLRKLVKNFTPKKNPKEEETTQKKEFKYE